MINLATANRVTTNRVTTNRVTNSPQMSNRALAATMTVVALEVITEVVSLVREEMVGVATCVVETHIGLTATMKTTWTGLRRR